MTERRRLLAIAGAVFVLTFAVYASMAGTGVEIGDEAEAQTVPYILGIAHPTGFPAYTLAGWVFSHALPFGTVAWRLTTFTALCTAVSVSGVFLLAATIAGDTLTALFAALVFAFGATVWTGALHANAQALAGTLCIWSLLACVVFARSGGVRALVAACALCGLGIATHPSSIWILPAIAVALLWQRRSLSVRTLGVSLAALAVPLLLYGYLPLRSAYVATHGLDPAAAAPLYGIGSFDWNTDRPGTLAGFLDEVLARHESAGRMLSYAFDITSFPRAIALWFTLVLAQFRWWVLLLAAVGIAALGWADRRALSVLAAGSLGGMSFAYVYRHNAHLDRYLIVSFAIVAVLSAASARLTIARLPAQGMRTIVVAMLAALAVLAFSQNRPPAVWYKHDGEAIIAAVQRDTPDGAIVVAQWNDAAALGYGAFIEHALGSRVIVSAWPMQYRPYYEKWAQSRPVVVYVSTLGLNRMWPYSPPDTREVPSSAPNYRAYQISPPGGRDH